MQAQTEPFRFLRLPEVQRATGLSRSQIYRLQANGQFPERVKLGASASAWIDREVAQWQADRIASRDAKPAA
jgi:prophage regulatory protein